MNVSLSRIIETAADVTWQIRIFHDLPCACLLMDTGGKFCGHERSARVGRWKPRATLTSLNLQAAFESYRGCQLCIFCVCAWNTSSRAFLEVMFSGFHANLHIQSSSDVLPVSLVCVPDGHEWHWVCCSISWYVPLGHFSHGSTP